MSWSFVGAGTLDEANNTGTMTAAVPAGIAENDLLLIAVYIRDATLRTPTTPSGWTIAAQDNGSNGSLTLYYKLAGVSESSVTVSTPGTNTAGNTQLCQMVAYRGNATASPLGNIGSFATWASATNLGPITGLTPATAGSLLIVLGAKQNDFGGTVSLLTDANATFAEAIFAESTLGTDAGMEMQHAFLTGTPTIGSKTFTDSVASAGAGKGVMVTFKPAATGSPQALSGSVTGKALVQGKNLLQYATPTAAQLSLDDNVVDTTMTGGPFNNTQAIYVQTPGVLSRATVNIVMPELVLGVQYRISCYVKMDDGGAPVLDNGSTSATDFNLRIHGQFTNDQAVVHVGDNVYRIAGTKVAGTGSFEINGIVKLATHSTRTFKVTGYQLEVDPGSTTFLVYNNGASAPQLTAAMKLTGSDTATGTVSGTLPVKRPLVGSVTSTGTVVGSLGVLGQTSLVGAVTGTGTVTGALKVARPLSGGVIGNATLSAVLTKAVRMVGAATGTGTAAGTVHRDVGFSGSITGTATADAAFAGTSTMSGSVLGTLTVTGTLGLKLDLVGNLTGKLVVATPNMDGGGLPPSAFATTSGLLGDRMFGADDTTTRYGFIQTSFFGSARLRGSATLAFLQDVQSTYFATATVRGGSVIRASPSAGLLPVGASLFVVTNPDNTSTERAGYASTGVVK